MNPHPNPLQPDWAAALLDPERPAPPGLRAWNGSDPARRFAVHRNNVVASLVSALADGFPVVQALVGEEFFRAMAAVFVYFLWSTAMAQPWSVAVIAVFIACSWAIEMLLAPKGPAPPLGKVAQIR